MANMPKKKKPEPTTTLHSAATNAAEFLKSVLDMEPNAAVDALTNNGEAVEEELSNALQLPPATYTYEHLEAAACMWEHVLGRLRRPNHQHMEWEDYKDAYGMASLRAAVIRHAPEL